MCDEIIRQLHNEGHEIYIITARDSEFHENPYLQSEAWLNENNIHFDKLIVNARDKKTVCLENDIDLLIDDSISNCLGVSSVGIPNNLDIDMHFSEDDDFFVKTINRENEKKNDGKDYEDER